MYSDHSRECRDHTRQDTVTLIPGAIVKGGWEDSERTVWGEQRCFAVDVQTGMCAIVERISWTDFSKNELKRWTN
jgi:hypothetical protein